MERELWPVLCRTVSTVGRGFQQKYVHIRGWVLLLTLLWAALHDRPVCWACQPKNWATTRLRPPRIPSASTMSRRIDHVGLGLLWRAVEEHLRADSAASPALVAFLDAKPLPVGGASKDPDARCGRAVGGMAKGYKLHTVWSTRALPEAWAITPMNAGEATVARGLLPPLRGGGYLLADGNYDSNVLFDLAASKGYQLVTPLPKGNPGHQYQSPYRLRSIALMKTRFGERLYRNRIGIEEAYGNATSFGGGLAPLPAWVRGVERVRTWVWAKLLITAARILKNKDAARLKNVATLPVRQLLGASHDEETCRSVGVARSGDRPQRRGRREAGGQEAGGVKKKMGWDRGKIWAFGAAAIRGFARKSCQDKELVRSNGESAGRRAPWQRGRLPAATAQV